MSYSNLSRMHSRQGSCLRSRCITFNAEQRVRCTSSSASLTVMHVKEGVGAQQRGKPNLTLTDQLRVFLQERRWISHLMTHARLSVTAPPPPPTGYAPFVVWHLMHAVRATHCYDQCCVDGHMHARTCTVRLISREVLHMCVCMRACAC